MRFLEMLKRRLGAPRFVVALVAIAVLMTLPSITAGFYFDDLAQQLRVKGFSGLPAASPTDLFSFIPGDPASSELMKAHGFLPWYALPDARLSFWRPLSSISHWIDYSRFPDRPGLMHLQNIAWYALFAALVLRLYRRFIEPAWVAGLAGLLFVIDDAHGLTVSWICNRNALISATFGVLTLLAHRRWVEAGRKRDLAAALLCLGLGLLAAEAAIATCAYLAAYAVCIDPRDLRRRVLSLVPYGMLVGVWRVIYSGLGYGVRGSDTYLDPGSDPGPFLAAMPDRALVYLQAQLAWPPASLLPGALQPDQSRVAVAAVVCLIWAGWVLYPILRREATLRFWALGSMLALVPICGARPQDRNLFFVGIGAMAVIAGFLGTLADRARWPALGWRWKGPAVALGLFWVLIHAVVAPLTMPAAMKLTRVMSEAGRQIRQATELGPSIERQTLVVVGVPNVLMSSLWSAPVEPEDRIPARSLTLAVTPGRLEVERRDANTLVLRPEGGLMSELTSRMARGLRFPFRAGDRVRMPDAEFEVKEVTPYGRPAEVVVRFDRVLEDPGLHWIAWDGKRFAAFTPPAAGGRVAFEPIDLRAGVERKP